MCAVLLEAPASGPLLQYYGGFAEYLVAQGYTAKHARKLKKLCRDLDQWLAHVNLGVGELRQLEIDRFQAAQKSVGRKIFVSTRALLPLMIYLRGVGAAPVEPACVVEGPLESLLQRYRGYLRTERGIKDDTARTYVSLVRPFLATRVSVDGAGLDLKTLSEAHVISFVVATCPKMGSGVASSSVTALRSVLSFLHVDGIIDRSLTSAVPTVPGRRLTGLPRGLEPGVTERLLASCDTDTHSGSRSFAVLTMLTRLGLRAGELAKLQLDDINWRTGEVMIVQSKGNRTDSLPLPPDVGEALAGYLQRWRPSAMNNRTVFVRTRAPRGALTSCSVTKIVADAAMRCGIDPIYAHRLRHTAATQMLRNGASLPEIGQVLRHRSTITTAIYAKVDREALRSIARAWPGDVA